MANEDPVFDVVIVGSGISGLACARMLALRGWRVCVVEKSAELGGHLTPFERAGVLFEVGVHYLADTSPRSQFGRACSALGINPRIVPLDPSFEEIRTPAGGSFLYKAPLQEFVLQLKEQWPAYVRAWDMYEDYLQLLWDIACPMSFPLRTKDVWAVALRHPQRTKLVRLACMSARDFFCKELKLPPDVAEFLLIQHVLIGVAPEKLSALAFLLVHRYYFENPCFVEGGGAALRDALMHENVTYRTCTLPFVNKVSSHKGLERGSGKGDAVLPGRGPVRFSVELKSSEIVDSACSEAAQQSSASFSKIWARHVVWTPDPRLFCKHSDISLGWFLRLKLKNVETPHALVVGYFATTKPLLDLNIENRNYWLQGELDSSASYRERDLLTLARHAPVYVSTGSLRDPLAIQPHNRLGAQGVFQAMFLVPADPSLWGGCDEELYRVPESRGGFGTVYRDRKAQILKILEERVCRELRLNSEELVWRELGTPLTHRRYLHAPGLNGYGYAPTVKDFLWGRPSWDSGIEGLSFCGAYIRPTHGLVTCLVNGVGLARKLST